MVRLLIMRHAKSSWKTPGLGDFDRPLGSRGERDAPRMGAFIAARGCEPDLVLCSSAQRARETLDLVLREFAHGPHVLHERALYHAGPGTLLREIQKVDARCETVLVIGHNPGLHGLAIALIDDGESEHYHQLRTHFPTAAVALFSFTATTWKKVDPGTGRLEFYMVPKRLDD